MTPGAQRTGPVSGAVPEASCGPLPSAARTIDLDQPFPVGIAFHQANRGAALARQPREVAHRPFPLDSYPGPLPQIAPDQAPHAGQTRADRRQRTDFDHCRPFDLNGSVYNSERATFRKSITGGIFMDDPRSRYQAGGIYRLEYCRRSDPFTLRYLRFTSGRIIGNDMMTP